ncbi:ABC transporter permease [Virgibacillus kekensis]|uniref:ABC transporter permease n=1 Tax=Virgibacillus kekensis TaxID=202261 RepID=A0ABV9DMX7_9BACI
MLRFIWNSWWRHKERFILLIVGALIVSIGLSYLVGITQASNATIVDELQKRWKSSYHIVVRPPDSRSVTEDKNLLEPNYLSGLAGGITMEQYEKIKSMEDIDVAAPIAMMGYIYNTTELGQLDYKEPGVYRLTRKETTDTGVAKDSWSYTDYFTVGWSGPLDPREYGVGNYVESPIAYGSNVLVAGIDPEAEAALVGIDDAIIEQENNRYFTKEDISQEIPLGESLTNHQIPVILSNQTYVDGKITFTIEKVDIDAGEDLNAAMEKVKEKGGKEFLDKRAATQIDKLTFTAEDAHEAIIQQVSEGSGSVEDFNWMPYKPSAVNYREVSSPFVDRWPFAYEVEPYVVPEDSLLAVDYAYRPVNVYSEDSKLWPRLKLDFKGVFDPHKLDISKDPLTELPMETYFPSKAQLVLNNQEKPVNPPRKMKPLNSPYGFITKPPLILTTLEAAEQVLGEKSISAIRIKVKGVEQISLESEQLLKSVARKIEEETGLITDVTLGSSPQPALTHIPSVGDKENIGWVEQPWIKLGSSVTIFHESKVGLSGIIASVIAVAILYVFSSNVIMMYARKKEFAVLLSVGWRPNQLTKLLFMEATVIGLFVSLVSWLILGLIYVIHDVETSVWRILLIGIFGMAIYTLGALLPGILVRKIAPFETMKSGEVSQSKRRLFKTRTIFGMSLKNFLTKWKRSMLSVIAIALPTGLLIFFLYVTFRLRGAMYTTWLGEFVAMEVGPMHYVAMGVALAIAILTTAEIIWQNVTERQPELAVLKAVGWKNRTVQALVLIEGALCGLLAGVIGLLISMGIIYGMYGEFPMDQLPFFTAAILIPVVTGVLGAILPAGKAGRIQPYQGLSGGFSNTKKVEKSFQYVFAIAGAVLFIGIIGLLTQAVPEAQDSAVDSEVNNSNVKGTSGEVKDVISVDSDNEEQESEKEESDASDDEQNVSQEKESIESIVKESREIYELGKTYTDNLDVSYTFNLSNDHPKEAGEASSNNELMTLILDVKNEHEFEGPAVQYLPQSTYNLVDGEGNLYEPVNWEVIKSDNWKGRYRLHSPGHLVMALTFEIPKSTPELILKGYHSFWAKSGILVVDLMGNVAAGEGL